MTGRRPRALPKLPPGAVDSNAERNAWLWDVMADKALPPTTRLVAMAYGMRVNKDTLWTWTSSRGIAEATGQRRSDVQRHVATLVNGGERPNKADPDRPHRSRPYLYQQTTARGGWTYTALLRGEPVRNMRTGGAVETDPTERLDRNVRTGSELIPRNMPEESASCGINSDRTVMFAPTGPQCSQNLSAHTGPYLRNLSGVSTATPNVETGSANSAPPSGSGQKSPPLTPDQVALDVWMAEIDAWDQHGDEPMPMPPIPKGGAA